MPPDQQLGCMQHAAGAAPLPWLVPAGLPIGVRAAFTLRLGGSSPDPWRSFNLGLHVGDDPRRVMQHRERLRQAVGHPLCWVDQVHGAAVARWHQPSDQAVTADALWTDAPGEACVIQVADCLPVLWWSDKGDVVAASHAGWRGLLGHNGIGVLEATHAVLQQQRPQAHWQAWLGPCIGPAAFEVGPEVRSAFVHAEPESADHFVPHPQRPGKCLADLPSLARMRLRRLGVENVTGNPGTANWCTYSDGAHFFSHRRDGQPAGTGRMAAVIWRDG